MKTKRLSPYLTPEADLIAIAEEVLLCVSGQNEGYDETQYDW